MYAMPGSYSYPYSYPYPSLPLFVYVRRGTRDMYVMPYPYPYSYQSLPVYVYVRRIRDTCTLCPARTRTRTRTRYPYSSFPRPLTALLCLSAFDRSCHPCQHRNYSFEQCLSVFPIILSDSLASDQEVQDCTTLPRGTAGYLQESHALRRREFSTAFREIQNNGLGSADEMVTRIPVRSSIQLFRYLTRPYCKVQTHPVDIESLVVKTHSCLTAGCRVRGPRLCMCLWYVYVPRTRTRTRLFPLFVYVIRVRGACTLCPTRTRTRTRLLLSQQQELPRLNKAIGREPVEIHATGNPGRLPGHFMLPGFLNPVHKGR